MTGSVVRPLSPLVASAAWSRADRTVVAMLAYLIVLVPVLALALAGGRWGSGPAGTVVLGAVTLAALLPGPLVLIGTARRLQAAIGVDSIDLHRAERTARWSPVGFVVSFLGPGLLVLVGAFVGAARPPGGLPGLGSVALLPIAFAVYPVLLGLELTIATYLLVRRAVRHGALPPAGPADSFGQADRAPGPAADRYEGLPSDLAGRLRRLLGGRDLTR